MVAFADSHIIGEPTIVPGEGLLAEYGLIRYIQTFQAARQAKG